MANAPKIFNLWLLWLLCGVTAPVLAEETNQQQVRKFVDAFNQQNAAAMAELVTQDIRWFSVRGDQVVVEVAGKEALASAMTDYFAACSSCRSQILGLAYSAQRVSAVEEASWSSPQGKQAQVSMAVYELSDGLISAVYYFPEEASAAK